jgi:hypothetical protein
MSRITSNDPGRANARFLLAMAILGMIVPACTADQRGTAPPVDVTRELRLTRMIPWQVRKACADAARFATVRVICPRLIPDVPITTMKHSFGAAVGSEQPRIYMMTFDKDFFGSTPPPKGVKHWVVGGGQTKAVKKWVLSDFAHEVEGDARFLRTVERAGHQVSIYRFPDYPGGGLNGSHTLAMVHVGDEVVSVSVHGDRYVETAIEMVIDVAEQALARDGAG